MKNYHNIECRKTNGYYVAYDGTGRSWRITGHSGNWTALASVTVQGLVNLLIGYDNLDEISCELTKIRGA